MRMLAAAKSEPRPIVDERAENKANSRDLAGQSSDAAVAEGGASSVPNSPDPMRVR